MTGSVISPKTKAVADLIAGFSQRKVWMMLGWLDIKQRYRRSVLGPFWLTISTGVFVGAMGPLYGTLFGQPINDYLPYVAASVIVWFFIHALCVDSCQVFIAAGGHIKHTRLPLSLFVFRVIWRNLLIFLHSIVILIPVYLFMPTPVNVNTLLALFGILLIVINAVWIGLVLGLVCARYRDVPLIVISLLQVAFFITPIFWKPEMLGERIWIAKINPLFHMIEVVRQPLLGMAPSIYSWGCALGMSIVGMIIALSLFSRFRSRIAYWI